MISKREGRVVAWICAGAMSIFALAWFLSKRFAGAGGQDLAAWLQAVGSIAAILAAFLVGRQTIAEERNERRRSIVAVAGAAAEHARRIREVLDRGDDPGNVRMYNVYDKSIVDSMVHALTNAPAHEVGSPEGVIALLALRDQCVFLGVQMEAYLRGPWKLEGVQKAIESCGDDRKAQRDTIQAAEQSLRANVRMRLEQIQLRYSELAPADGVGPDNVRMTRQRKSGLPRRLRRLNVAGLVLTIIGVIMVWQWGLPQPSFDPSGAIFDSPGTRQPGGQTNTQIDAETAALKIHYRRMSEWGMVFIVGGFVFQLASELAPYIKPRGFDE